MYAIYNKFSISINIFLVLVCWQHSRMFLHSFTSYCTYDLTRLLKGQPLAGGCEYEHSN